MKCLRCTPPKINMEPENYGLEDVSAFPGVYCQVPCKSSQVYWWGMYISTLVPNPWYHPPPTSMEDGKMTGWRMDSSHFGKTCLEEGTFSQGHRVCQCISIETPGYNLLPISTYHTYLHAYRFFVCISHDNQHSLSSILLRGSLSLKLTSLFSCTWGKPILENGFRFEAAIYLDSNIQEFFPYSILRPSTTVCIYHCLSTLR